MTDMNLALMDNTALRAAIQRNLVSFPAQVPAFAKDGDEQRRVVQLYFVRGWQTKAICDHYGLSKSRLRTLLLEWKIRAVAAGYIQEIFPEVLRTVVEEVDRRNVFEESMPDSDFATSESVREMVLSPRVASVEARL